MLMLKTGLFGCVLLSTACGGPGAPSNGSAVGGKADKIACVDGTRRLEMRSGVPELTSDQGAICLADSTLHVLCGDRHLWLADTGRRWSDTVLGGPIFAGQGPDGQTNRVDLLNLAALGYQGADDEPLANSWNLPSCVDQVTSPKDLCVDRPSACPAGYGQAKMSEYCRVKKHWFPTSRYETVQVCVPDGQPVWQIGSTYPEGHEYYAPELKVVADHVLVSCVPSGSSQRLTQRLDHLPEQRRYETSRTDEVNFHLDANSVTVAFSGVVWESAKRGRPVSYTTATVAARFDSLPFCD